MDTTTEDSNKLSNLYDTPSEPLLSYPPYPPQPTPSPSPITTSDPEDQTTHQQQYLQITYTHSPRPFKDLPFLLLFLLFLLSTVSLGIFASFNHNPTTNPSSFTYDPLSSSCLQNQSSFHRHNPLFLNKPILSNSSFFKILIFTLVITLISSIPISIFLLFSLRHFTKHLVYISLPFFIIVPIFLNIYWFVACTVSSSCSDAFPLGFRILVLVFVFLLIGVVVWIFVINWHRIELTAKIIGVASNALASNLKLFGVLPALTLGLFVYYAPIVVFLVFARMNGRIVPRERSGEYDCVWKQDGWVAAYYALAILTMLWSAAAMVEAQVYVISGTVAQWYFSRDDSGPKRSIRSSLRNAFGPSSGTICLSGLLICVVRVVRAAVDSAGEEAPGIVNLILRCCVNALLTAFEFVNKFTINFAAITGEAYCTSARMTYELLKRNLLSAVFVETVSTRVLAGIIFVLSAIYAIVVCAILKAVIHLGRDSYFVALAAWVLLIVVLSLFVHVLDNVIDTVYVCYAIDRDRGEVCKQEVHEVYVHLPVSRNPRSSFVSRTTPVV